MYTSYQKFISYHHFPDVFLHGSESSINIRKALIELLQHEKYSYINSLLSFYHCIYPPPILDTQSNLLHHYKFYLS